MLRASFTRGIKIASIKFLLVLLVSFCCATCLGVCKSYADDNSLSMDYWNSLSQSELDETDIEIFEMTEKYVAFDVNCSAMGNGDRYDALIIDTYIRKGKAAEKHVKKVRIDPEDYFEESDDYHGMFRIRNLKANTKYTIRFDIKTENLGYEKSITRTMWTAPRVISGNSIHKNGNRYTWKKSKKTTGYIVCYSKKRYLGKNIYGTRVYDRRYLVKFTKKPEIVLGNGNVIEEVIPFTKHDGLYYYVGYAPVETKIEILREFKYTSDEFYE